MLLNVLGEEGGCGSLSIDNNGLWTFDLVALVTPYLGLDSPYSKVVLDSGPLPIKEIDVIGQPLPAGCWCICT